PERVNSNPPHNKYPTDNGPAVSATSKAALVKHRNHGLQPGNLPQDHHKLIFVLFKTSYVGNNMLR
ncbi:hypothetical protein L9F63_009360, partial [Diploptera punctata]